MRTCDEFNSAGHLVTNRDSRPCHIQRSAPNECNCHPRYGAMRDIAPTLLTVGRLQMLWAFG